MKFVQREGHSLARRIGIEPILQDGWPKAVRDVPLRLVRQVAQLQQTVRDCAPGRLRQGVCLLEHLQQPAAIRHPIYEPLDLSFVEGSPLRHGILHGPLRPRLGIRSRRGRPCRAGAKGRAGGSQKKPKGEDGEGDASSSVPLLGLLCRLALLCVRPAHLQGAVLKERDHHLVRD